MRSSAATARRASSVRRGSTRLSPAQSSASSAAWDLTARSQLRPSAQHARPVGTARRPAPQNAHPVPLAASARARAPQARAWPSSRALLARTTQQPAQRAARRASAAPPAKRVPFRPAVMRPSASRAPSVVSLLLMAPRSALRVPPALSNHLPARLAARSARPAATRPTSSVASRAAQAATRLLRQRQSAPLATRARSSPPPVPQAARSARRAATRPTCSRASSARLASSALRVPLSAPRAFGRPDARSYHEPMQGTRSSSVKSMASLGRVHAIAGSSLKLRSIITAR